MSEALVRYPGPGCIVEYMEGNSPQIAWVSEEQGDKLRVLLPNRRETRLGANRLLPWSGPAGSASLSKEEAVEALFRHNALREERCRALDALAMWEAAQGEVSQAGALWFAELFENSPDVDIVAAYGRALLACKSHFKFQPPDFVVYSETLVQSRLAEQDRQRRRESLAAQGESFLRLLWDVYCRKRVLPPKGGPEWPDEETLKSLEHLLLSRIADPDRQEDESLWRQLGKDLPDLPYMPLHLACAWGLVPEHHNFWMDRADYLPGDAWAQEYGGALAELREHVRVGLEALPFSGIPFVSIDGKTTRDVDDAFFVEELPDERLLLHLALACPALCWPFGSELDKMVLRRATGIYLPEGTHHMLPEELGTAGYSLLAGEERPSLLLSCEVDGEGTARSCEISLCRVKLAANLHYEDCEAVLCAAPEAADPALAFARQLFLGERLARRLQEARIRRGAVVMLRPEPQYRLEGEDEDLRVVMTEGPPQRSQELVAEMMILAGSAVAVWGEQRGMPLLFRVQEVALPKEYAGVWTQPHDMARIMKALAPSELELAPRPHAALGVPVYSPVTSPLRRYPDMLNEAQVLHMLRHGRARWSRTELGALLPLLNARLDAAGQVQRFRPRYWKLLYVWQQGDKFWWDGVVTEENDNFVTVNLPREQVVVRGKRKLFNERAYAGQAVQLRLGKVNPLENKIFILEVTES
jgi:exoribonuclease-2